MKKVLIVEDDKDISAVMKTLLEGENIDVEVSGDASFLYRNDVFADVIILDLWVDKYDGADLYLEIRKNKNLSSSKVILISAASNILSIANQFNLPYIKKPFDIDEFIEKIKLLLVLP